MKHPYQFKVKLTTDDQPKLPATEIAARCICKHNRDVTTAEVHPSGSIVWFQRNYASNKPKRFTGWMNRAGRRWLRMSLAGRALPSRITIITDETVRY